LYWTFRGMTGLLVITFIFAGIHTLLWLPRSLQWRRKLKARHNQQSETTDEKDDGENKKEDEEN
jgi:hypothetical protein